MAVKKKKKYMFYFYSDWKWVPVTLASIHDVILECVWMPGHHRWYKKDVQPCGPVEQNNNNNNKNKPTLFAQYY